MYSSPQNPHPDSFDRLLSGIVLPGAQTAARLEFSEFGETFSRTDEERTPGICQEEVERSKIVQCARRCFDAPSSRREEELTHLLSLIVEKSMPSPETDLDIEEFDLEAPEEISETASSAAQHMRVLAFESYERSVVTHTLCALLERDRSLAALLGRIFSESSSPAVTGVVCHVMEEVGPMPESMQDLIIDRIDRVLSVEKSGSDGDSSLGSYLSLTAKRASPTHAQLQRLFRLSEHCTYDDDMVGNDWIKLEHSLIELARRFPADMKIILEEALQNVDTPPLVLIMGITIASNFTGSFRLDSKLFDRFLRDEDSRIREAVISLSGQVGADARELTPRLMSLAELPNESGEKAIVAIAKIGEPKELVSRFLVARWEERRGLELDPSNPDRRIRTDQIVSSSDSRDRQILMSLQVNHADARDPLWGLKAAIHALGIFAPTDRDTHDAFHDAARMESPLVRSFVLKHLPRTGAFSPVRDIFETLLRSASKGDMQPLILNLVAAYGDEGTLCAREFVSLLEQQAAVAIRDEEGAMLRRKSAGVTQLIDQAVTLETYRGNAKTQ